MIFDQLHELSKMFHIWFYKQQKLNFHIVDPIKIYIGQLPLRVSAAGFFDQNLLDRFF